MERAYERALLIQAGRSLGFWVPIMKHLAMRGFAPAMIDLASWMVDETGNSDFRKAAMPGDAANLYRRAHRQGDERAAQHMAMTCFNRHDLAGYRLWLRRAHYTGDEDALAELRKFETRLPHFAAKRHSRCRPHRRSER